MITVPSACPLSSQGIDALALERLAGRHEETAALLRELTKEKVALEKQLEDAKQPEDLLQIPVRDVTMTDIRLGGGAYGGKNTIA